jgi:hydrogenase-4 component B
MGLLVACCFVIGIAPRLLAPILGQGITAWAPHLVDAGDRLTALAPLSWITIMGLGLIVAVVLAGTLLGRRLHDNGVAQATTWGCGYAAPTARMQYTSSSFAQMLVALFSWALRPRIHQPRGLLLFPDRAHFHSEVPDTVLDGALLPAFRLGAWLLSWFRVFQQGSVQAYLLYLVVALIALLLWR